MKIFGVGLTRTGTTSLTEALQRVGFHMIHYPNETELFAGVYDSACDLPVVIYYKALDQIFPGTKFIYTIREKDDWLRSMEWYLEHRRIGFGLHHRILVYGQADFDRKVYSAAYDRHHNDVLTYFKSRPQDLLVLNICGGDGWAALCPFLDIDKGVGKFPHEHQQSYA